MVNYSEFLSAIKTPASLIALAMILIGSVIGISYLLKENFLIIIIAMCMIFLLAILVIILEVVKPGHLFYNAIKNENQERHILSKDLSKIQDEMRYHPLTRENLKSFLKDSSKYTHWEYTMMFISWLFSIKEPPNNKEIDVLIYCIRNLPNCKHTSGYKNTMINILGRNKKVSPKILPFFKEQFEREHDLIAKQALCRWLRNKPDSHSTFPIGKAPTEPCSPSDHKDWHSLFKQIMKLY